MKPLNEQNWSRNLDMREAFTKDLPAQQSPTICSCSTERWFAVLAMSRHEKVVARELNIKRIQHYLPLYWCVRQWSNRRKSVLLPLFPGYLFVRIRRDQQWLVFETRGVAKILGGSSGPTSIPEKEILDLKTVVESQVPMYPRVGLPKGQRVRVTREPLTGVEGVLEEYKNGYRLAVSIKLLGRSILVEIACRDLTPI